MVTGQIDSCITDVIFNTLRENVFVIKELKHQEDVLCSIIEHDMTSLSFQTAIQKKEVKLSSFVQLENEMLYTVIFN